MGKRQHQKDKLYLTYTEWSTLYGGKREGPEQSNFRRLPFDHCCVSLQPWENPYCDRDGNIFELEAILGFLKKFKVNPVTGKPLDSKSLIKLNFHKNAKDEFHCPVLYKPITKHSHIVSVAKTGNVFSNEAVQQLNVKTKSWKDLLTDEPFVRTDLITLQDPSNLTKFNLSNFHHLKHNLRVETEEEIEARGNPEARLKTVSKEARDILDTLNREYKAPEVKNEEKKVADKFNAAHYSTGAVAASFTSTAMVPETEHEAAIVEEDLVRYERVKKKACVRIRIPTWPTTVFVLPHNPPSNQVAVTGPRKLSAVKRSVRNVGDVVKRNILEELGLELSDEEHSTPVTRTISTRTQMCKHCFVKGAIVRKVQCNQERHLCNTLWTLVKTN